MLRVCVFAGSSASVDQKYLDAAKAMGSAIARRGMGMVYGGGAVGLMGACADAALAGKAEVVGVLPRALARSEVAHPNLTELRIVKTLHDRKAIMAALCDGFLALPGGCGTLDELFEAITWRQLGLHDKPIGVCDVAGYFDPLLRFLRDATAAGFVGPGVLETLPVRSTPDELLTALFA
ncbi:MAG TPA: TIGR00730 family Rossman fold protein [Myxococcales bacterium]|nr:TIGR00730 family Rossman fold protein [Myxococcales bacterium]